MSCIEKLFANILPRKRHRQSIKVLSPSCFMSPIQNYISIEYTKYEVPNSYSLEIFFAAYVDTIYCLVYIFGSIRSSPLVLQYRSSAIYIYIYIYRYIRSNFFFIFSFFNFIISFINFHITIFSH